MYPGIENQYTKYDSKKKKKSQKGKLKTFK